MHAFGRVLQVLLGLALLLAMLGAVGWFVYTSITEAPGVVAAVVTAFGALFGLFLQRFLEQQREEERHRRERMAPIYEELVETFYKGTAKGINERQLQAFFAQLAQRLLIWGRPDILKAWNSWRTAVGVLEEGSPESLLLFERFIFAMRADLGHDDKELTTGDLLRVFVNDIDEYLPEHQAAGLDGDR